MLAVCILVFFIGLLMVCLEIFIPGGIVGTAGAAGILISFWMAYTRLGSEVGSYFIFSGLLLVMAGISVSMIFFPKTRFSNRVFLSADQRGFASADDGLKEIEGLGGISLSRLRPSGIARVGGRRYSVVTMGEFIENGEKVKVVRVEGNRVIVKAIEEEQERSLKC